MNKNEDDNRSLYTKGKCKWLMLKIFLMYVVIT